MNQFKLQPYTTPSSRYRCPQCGHSSKSFVRYINTQTNQHLADHVGRCGREDKCGYHYKPRNYFADNPHLNNNGGWQPGNGFYPHKKPVNYAKQHNASTPSAAAIAAEHGPTPLADNPMWIANIIKDNRMLQPRTDHSPDLDHGPWTIDHGLKASDHRPSTTTHELTTKDYRPSTSCHGLSIMDHGLKYDHELSTSGYGLSTTNHGPNSIHPNIVNASFNAYERNNLVLYLIERFGRQLTSYIIGRYRFGTSKHWPGATVFWQIDTLGGARTGKIMLYNKDTGKRVKQPYNHIAWAHSVLSPKSGVLSPKSIANSQKSDSGLPTQDSGLQTKDFLLQQCLFGEHLLAEEPHKPVAIVESEKTAIIAAIHAPQLVWLATGGISNLNPTICQALQHRNVTLYPDLGAYDKWKQKARELQLKVKGATFTVSDVLELRATEEDRVKGLDLGDCL